MSDDNNHMTESSEEEIIIDDGNKNTASSDPEVDQAADEQGVDEQAETAEAKLAAMEEELASARDQVLRTQAEMQNLRRRVERDVENAHKYGVEKFVAELLPVVDNLERAIAAIDSDSGDHSAVIEGVELTLKSFVDALSRVKVEAVDPKGQPFNPQLHQAMSMVPNKDVTPNTVLEVFQKGYTLHGRLVRPAMVVVSSA